MRLLKIKVRWNSDKRQELINLGLDTEGSECEYKELLINCERITHIEEYEGYCCINFSAIPDDCVITNIQYKNASCFGQILNI